MDTAPPVARLASQTISVVIPARNEAANLPRTLASLDAQIDAPPHEVIVVDCDSTDATVAVAARGGARVVHAPPGRAEQMNRGAAKARGDVLLFLHADTTLAPDALATATAVLRNPRVAAAAFRFALDDDALPLRVVARGANLRARLGLPYGDQGLALRRATFAALGGFRAVPIMEDADAVLRLRRLGGIAIVPATATTSARRWREHGVCRTTSVNTAALGLFLCGVSPTTIRRVYDRLSRRPVAQALHERTPATLEQGVTRA